jgi:hypothetical protein
MLRESPPAERLTVELRAHRKREPLGAATVGGNMGVLEARAAWPGLAA